MYSSNLSLTSALDKGGWLTPRPGHFTPPGKTPSTHCIGGWVGPRTGLDGCGKYYSNHDFFVFSCTLYFIGTCFCLDCPAFCISWSLLTTHITNIHASSLCTLSVLLCPECPGYGLLSLLHNTQTSMPLAWFEPAIPASELPQTLALDRSATGIGNVTSKCQYFTILLLE